MHVHFSRRLRSCLALGVGVSGLALGLAAPAVAEGHFDSYLSGWYPGRESRQWIDLNQDSTTTRATFSSCNKDFKVTIFKEDFGPDTAFGTEWLQCGSSADAVYASQHDAPADEYHFTLQEGSNVNANVSVYW